MARRSLVAVVVVLALMPVGCGSRRRQATPALQPTATTSTTSEPGVGGSGATTATSASQPSGTAATSGVSGTSSSPPNNARGGPAPTATGTYKYRQSGQSTIAGNATPVPAEGTLKVDPAGSDGTQVWHRVTDASRGPADTTLAFRPDGVFLVSTTQGGGQLTCTFSPPLAAPPWPPAVGKTASGQANCGAFTMEVSSRTESTRQVTLDGASVQVFVVSSTITTRGQVESTGTEVDWYAPSLRLNVHIEVHAKGGGGAVPFSSDQTSDLVSARPS
jgi:hypothetical protein